MEFNGWKYSSHGDKLTINPKEPKVNPNSLVKYYALSEYSIDALTNKYLYFTHPQLLNDPFDSNRQIINIEDFSLQQYIKLYRKHSQFITPRRNVSEKRAIETIVEWYHNEKEELMDLYLTIYWHIMFKDWGILSLAGKADSILMWSYYTNHKGFLIEFDFELFNNNEIHGAFPINYCREYDQVYPTSISPDKEHILYISNVKSDNWAHEEEWRYLLNRPNMSVPDYEVPELSNDRRKVNYGVEKVKSIILGFKFFDGNIKGSSIGKDKYEYFLNPINPDDRLKQKILRFAGQNNICLRQVNTSDSNSFLLVIYDIKILEESPDRCVIETIRRK